MVRELFKGDLAVDFDDALVLLLAPLGISMKDPSSSVSFGFQRLYKPSSFLPPNRGIVVSL